MTGPEHYREAERLLSHTSYESITGTPVTRQGMPMRPEVHAALIARAQVHATLALTAATAMQAPVDGAETGMGAPEYNAWYDAAGVKPNTTKEK
ncbi:hypothetical protein [Streptomyces scabiei]|uniref:hypothetical protein n=1 Tax=Streptomyces scabiei TaxID=1930 RepID=UPI001B30F1FF|nr:hypothetical protein [Streptomyces sp. LBUM 1475]